MAHDKNQKDNSEKVDKQEANRDQNRMETPGASFERHQQAIDKAINENLKSETGSDKLDPDQINRNKPDFKPDISQKKAGRTSR